MLMGNNAVNHIASIVIAKLEKMHGKATKATKRTGVFIIRVARHPGNPRCMEKPLMAYTRRLFMARRGKHLSHEGDACLRSSIGKM